MVPSRRIAAEGPWPHHRRKTNVRGAMRLAPLLGPDIKQILKEDPDQIRELLDEIHPEDLADIVAELDPDEAAELLARIPAEDAAPIFERLEDHEQEELVEQMPAESVAEIASIMSADNRADL